MKIQIIRKAKYYLFKGRIHRLITANKLNFIGHMASVSKWISNHRNLRYSTFPSKKFDYNQRYNLYQFMVDNEILNEEIDYLEFGVSEGHSFRWWLENNTHKNSCFFGFDTFTGLPEDWGRFKKGDMSTGREVPQIDDSRHQFFKGIFQDTLYSFLSDYKVGKRKVVHLDADLYSATLFVLTTMSPFLKKGDILLFDEFNVPLHEFKAFTEWTNSFYIDYSVIGEVNNYSQVAIKIE